MSDVRQGSVTLEIGGRTFDIILSLNVIDILQERYGDMTAVTEKLSNYSELAWIVSQFINDSIDNHNEDFPDNQQKHVTEKWVKLKMSTFENVNAITKSILQTFRISIPEPSEDDTDPNLKTTVR